MIPKSLPPDLIRWCEPVFGQDHAQLRESDESLIHLTASDDAPYLPVFTLVHSRFIKRLVFASWAWLV